MVTPNTSSLAISPGNKLKAAALLRLLDQEALAAVCSHLRADVNSELRRLVDGMATRDISRTDLELLQEFEQFFQYAQRYRPALAGTPDSSLPADRMVIRRGQAPVLGDNFDKSSDPVGDLARLPVVQLGQALSGEQPRTIALLMARLPAERVAELLAQFPEARRSQVISEMMKDRSPAPALIERLAEAVLEHTLSLPTEVPPQPDRVERLVLVLRSVEKSQRVAMIAGIEAQDPETAAKILEKLCEFEDLLEADDRLVQGVLGQVDTTTLATALNGAEEALKEKIIKNLSSRAKQALKEELEFQKKVSPRKVEQARTTVAQVLAKLDREQDQE